MCSPDIIRYDGGFTDISTLILQEMRVKILKLEACLAIKVSKSYLLSPSMEQSPS
jgi:hypothetical protein